jgi:hypothetical protein
MRMVAGPSVPMEPRKQMRNMLATLTAVLADGALAGFGGGALVFTPRSDGSATASIPAVGDVATVLVNTEPLGGSDAPTSEPVLTATLT